MADYKELLRRAISALPENNGAARRAVYEKARAALVGQLRAIQPPLPAREITQHRLQLEDCIRQVEQEASEAVINLGRDAMYAPRPASPPPPASPKPEPAPAPQAAPVFVAPPEPEAPAPEPVFEPEPAPEPVLPPQPVAETPVFEPEPELEPESDTLPADAMADAPVEDDPTLSIEDIISQAANNSGAQVEPVVAPLEAKPRWPNRGPARTEEEDFVPPPVTPAIPIKSPSIMPRRDAAVAVPAAANASFTVPPAVGRIEPGMGSNAALARQTVVEPAIVVAPVPVEPALSSVREVEVDPTDTREAEGAIERAIETLDREARGEPAQMLPEREERAALSQAPADNSAAEPGTFEEADGERRKGAGVTIFLIVFAFLLVGAGGAGFWAWREGYVDLDQMFGRATPVATQTTETPVVSTPTLDVPAPDDTTTGPGNTATTTATEPTTSIEGIDQEDRLEPTPEAVTPTGNEAVLPSINGGENKTEERLSGADTSIAATNDPASSVDPAVLAGSQSLLLEASADGRTGAVPFSGTVEWTRGEDELGLPTLVGEASIPARNLNVSVTIRKNSDPSLPASHLLEVNFGVNDTFVGGSISSLPGILLKNEELVPGTPLVGASARVMGNSFLFALSASPNDETTNTQLLESRRWLDLAIVYGTGRNAILTLEKDPDAQALFTEVFGAWAK